MSNKKSKVALVILFNQCFPDNIPKLRKIYGERFHHIYFVIPFYKGEKRNDVIPYQSHQFFLENAWYEVSKFPFPHGIKTICFIADDVLLNPRINEWNLLQELGIYGNEAFVQNGFPYSNYMLHRPWEFLAHCNLHESIRKMNDNFSLFKSLDRKHGLIRKFQEYGGFTTQSFVDTSAVQALVERREMTDFTSSDKMQDKYTLLISQGLCSFMVLPRNILEKFGNFAKIYGEHQIFVEYSLFPCLLQCISPKRIKSFCNTPLYFTNFIQGFSFERDIVFDPKRLYKSCIHNKDGAMTITHIPDKLFGLHQVKLSRVSEDGMQFLNKIK